MQLRPKSYCSFSYLYKANICALGFLLDENCRWLSCLNAFGRCSCEPNLIAPYILFVWRNWLITNKCQSAGSFTVVSVVHSSFSGCPQRKNENDKILFCVQWKGLWSTELTVIFSFGWHASACDCWFVLGHSTRSLSLSPLISAYSLSLNICLYDIMYSTHMSDKI